MRAHKSRRLLLAKWRRTTRCEFWPPWVFYPPVIAHIASLMVKHRSATLFTAANPGMPAGGFIGESKVEILRSLAGAGDFVARFAFIDGSLPPSEKLRRVERFMAEHELGFPIVLKPDQGQRGSGVAIVRSRSALVERLHRTAVDTIVQEYVAGDEFGVFYYRYPSSPRGRIFSVTAKTFPTVVGDGCRTLEQLILDHDRA